MSETTTWMDGKDCFRCGRHFDVLRPELWAYTDQADGKRQWFCSWRCLRAWQRENGDLDPEPEEPAGRPHDRAAIAEQVIDAWTNDGTDPVEYLKGIGYKDPPRAWENLKYWSKKARPDLYERLPKPKRPRKKREPAIRTVKAGEIVAAMTVNEDMAEQARRAERVMVTLNEENQLPISALKSKVLSSAEYRKSGMNGMTLVIGRSAEAKTVSLSCEKWLGLIDEIPKAIAQLGVKPDGEE